MPRRTPSAKPRADPLSADRENTLRITEIYPSIQGETTHGGKPCVFVRLTGCNLRCSWCDSVYTFTGGEHRSVEDVAQEAHALGIHTVEVTGGEPLVQKAAVPLMQRLIELGHEVMLETSGSRDISVVPEPVIVIMDLKAPDSGEADSNRWENIPHLRPHHEVKFVIASRRDYEWARGVIAEHTLSERCTVLISPAWGLVDMQALVQWMLDDHLPARLSLQIHKVIWDKDTKGV